MKRWLAALGLVAVLTLPVETRVEGGSLVFDTTPGGAGGTLNYDGAGGPAIGTDIVFVNIQGNDTALNSGVLLTCSGCLLNFATGANTVEGPPGWSWAGGGSFTLTGSVPALGIVDEVLLSGAFTGTTNTPGMVGETSGLFFAIGLDVKNPTLLSFYGESNPFQFANTEIALDALTVNPVTGAFTSIPNQADIINASQVKNPWTLALLGLGLVGIGIVGRRIT
jgi:hypothetical protein